ncbi:hypothetical protein [Cohnella zeiphila]|nr:hypothetical protein [Cohnella zeiphila]
MEGVDQRLRSRIEFGNNSRNTFPCHKSMMSAVENAPEKPDRFVETALDLLQNPTYEKCTSFAQMMLDFRAPGITYNQAVSLFVGNNEWNRLEQDPPLSDR